MPDLGLSARYTSSTMIAWQLFCGGWGLAGAAMLAAGPVLGPALWLPGLALLLIFGLLFLQMPSSFGDPATVVTISAESYHDRRLGVPVPWTEVRSLRRNTARSRTFLLFASNSRSGSSATPVGCKERCGG
ncbi:hypothetical protein [Tabrizicola sp.]|uniref:hypothetical protein n=1 Tax=Tabrizicola sp. TaxID=2005166 RepID=UPI003F35AB09